MATLENVWLREVFGIAVALAQPDVEGDQLNDDGQVDQLTEDGSFRNENPWVADVGK